MENNKSIKKWPDGPNYFTKTDVDSNVRNLPENALTLGLPYNDTDAELAFLVNFPLLTMHDEYV